MKKRLLLSALTCVLALGLVSACTDEEETTKGDESTSQTDGGESGGAETVTLSNYTISFSFVDEEGEATAIPDWCTVYLCGSWDSWGEFVALTETSGVYSYTFTSITSGTYDYKGVLCYTEDGGSWNDNEIITSSSGGNASFTVSGTEGDGYTAPAVEVTLTQAALDKVPYTRVYLTNYTVAFTFLGEDGETTTIEDGSTLYIIGGWDEWTEFLKCELDSSTSVYSYTFEIIEAGSYKFKGVAVPEGEDPAYGYTDEETQEWVPWDAITGVGGGDATLTISATDTSDGHVQSINVGPDGVMEGLGANGTINVTIALENTEEIETYEESTETELTWYFDGFEWMNADTDYKVQRTLTAYEETDYNYDYYITIEDVDLRGDYDFAISPYEYQDNLAKTGIAPSDDLEIVWSEENFYLWGSQYVLAYKDGEETEDWDNTTYSEWGFGFSNLTPGCVLEEAEELTVVLQLDFSSVTNAWDATNNVVSGFYFLVDGVSTAA